MGKLVTYDGKRWRPSIIVLRGTTSNMAVNTASVNTPIFQYECLRNKMYQFRNAQVRKNELWMLLADAVDENDDDALIRVGRHDANHNWIETIWEGVYGQIPAAASRVSVDNIVVPSTEVRIEEGDYVEVWLNDDEAITVANSDIELRAEEFLLVH